MCFFRLLLLYYDIRRGVAKECLALRGLLTYVSREFIYFFFPVSRVATIMLVATPRNGGVCKNISVASAGAKGFV